MLGCFYYFFLMDLHKKLKKIVTHCLGNSFTKKNFGKTHTKKTKKKILN